MPISNHTPNKTDPFSCHHALTHQITPTHTYTHTSHTHTHTHTSHSASHFTSPAGPCVRAFHPAPSCSSLASWLGPAVGCTPCSNGWTRPEPASASVHKCCSPAGWTRIPYGIPRRHSWSGHSPSEDALSAPGTAAVETPSPWIPSPVPGSESSGRSSCPGDSRTCLWNFRRENCYWGGNTYAELVGGRGNWVHEVTPLSSSQN